MREIEGLPSVAATTDRSTLHAQDKNNEYRACMHNGRKEVTQFKLIDITILQLPHRL